MHETGTLRVTELDESIIVEFRVRAIYFSAIIESMHH
jgi:hypothetical protein